MRPFYFRFHLPEWRDDRTDAASADRETVDQYAFGELESKLQSGRRAIWRWNRK